MVGRGSRQQERHHPERSPLERAAARPARRPARRRSARNHDDRLHRRCREGRLRSGPGSRDAWLCDGHDQPGRRVLRRGDFTAAAAYSRRGASHPKRGTRAGLRQPGGGDAVSRCAGAHGRPAARRAVPDDPRPLDRVGRRGAGCSDDPRGRSAGLQGRPRRRLSHQHHGPRPRSQPKGLDPRPRHGTGRGLPRAAQHQRPADPHHDGRPSTDRRAGHRTDLRRFALMGPGVQPR